MGPLQIVLGTLAVLLLVVSVVYATKAVRAMLRIFRTGQPDPTRSGDVGPRLKTLAVESLGHTRMLKWSAIGAAHWFVFLASTACSSPWSRRSARCSTRRSTCR